MNDPASISECQNYTRITTQETPRRPDIRKSLLSKKATFNSYKSYLTHASVSRSRDGTGPLMKNRFKGLTGGKRNAYLPGRWWILFYYYYLFFFATPFLCRYRSHSGIGGSWGESVFMCCPLLGFACGLESQLLPQTLPIQGQLSPKSLQLCWSALDQQCCARNGFRVIGSSLLN